jgi:hypothetical protein
MSAPIELFIAVIIMALSMGLAFFRYGNVSDTQCEYRLKTQNERLQEAMQEVAMGSWGTSKLVDYTMERCTGRSVEAVRVIHYAKPEYCDRCAGNYGGGCWVVEPLTYSVGADGEGLLAPLVDSSVCVELSESLRLNIDATCNGVVTESVCPTRVQGKAVSQPECERMSYASSGAYDNALFATFERVSEGNHAFRIKITKSATAGNIEGSAGQLDLCVSQVS